MRIYFWINIFSLALFFSAVVYCEYARKRRKKIDTQLANRLRLFVVIPTILFGVSGSLYLSQQEIQNGIPLIIPIICNSIMLPIIICILVVKLIKPSDSK